MSHPFHDPAWPPPPPHLELRGGEVHLWRIPLDRGAEGHETLSGAEHARADRFLRAGDRHRFLNARTRLRQVLGRYADLPPAALEIHFGLHGKPALSGSHAWLRFNLSHAEGWMLLAVSRAREVGVDLEAVREEIDFAGVAAHCFRPEEVRALEQLSAADRPARFYALWTATEARLKARGLGFLEAEPAAPHAWTSWPGKRAAGFRGCGRRGRRATSTSLLVMAELSPSLPREVVIEPWRGWFHLPWQEYWEYRDLLVMLIQRDFTARYKQTILGPLWFVLQPLLTTAMFVLVFGHVIGISTAGVPPVLFYFCGLTAWNYFAQNVTSGSTTFSANAHLFGKVYFPRLIVPAAVVVSNLMALALQIPLFFLLFAWCHFFTAGGAALHLTWKVLLFPLLLVQISLLSFGVGLWLSSASAKYRDLVHLNGFLIQLWMFATPVIYPLAYPLSKLPPSLTWLAWLNPMASIVEAFRISLLGQGSLPPIGPEVSILLTLLVVLTGVAFFQRCERTAMDNV